MQEKGVGSWGFVEKVFPKGIQNLPKRRWETFKCKQQSDRWPPPLGLSLWQCNLLNCHFNLELRKDFSFLIRWFLEIFQTSPDHQKSPNFFQKAHLEHEKSAIYFSGVKLTHSHLKNFQNIVWFGRGSLPLSVYLWHNYKPDCVLEPSSVEKIDILAVVGKHNAAV